MTGKALLKCSPLNEGAPARRLGWRALGAVLLVAAATFTVTLQPAQAQERRINVGGAAVSQVVVRPGSTLTIRTDQPFADIVVGNAEIADVVPLSDRAFYIEGRAPGVTSISLYDGGDGLLAAIETRISVDFTDVRSAINAAVPSAQVTVSNFNNRIHLSGLVKSGPDLVRVLEVAQQFSAEPVINALAVSGAQQVALEVRVLEARRGNGRDLGINFRAAGGSFLGVTGSRLRLNADPDTKQPTSFLDDNAERNSQGTPFGSMIAQVLEGAGVRIDVIINALEKKGLARRLAQPTLTTISGEQASFHAGGEVPIQTAVQGSSGAAATQTEYRPYGVRLEFLPTVLDDDLINLRVMTEVSEIDAAVMVNGNPGFSSRKAKTVIELRDGQSFAMAGLLQSVNARTVEQLPWLGQVPVLGALFRSTSFQKQETDLVIVVTPRLVRPAGPDEQLYSPLDQTRPSDDLELFALGILEVDKEMIQGFKAGSGVAGPFGHIIELGAGR